MGVSAPFNMFSSFPLWVINAQRGLLFISPTSISVQSPGNVHGRISHIRVLTILMLYGILRVEEMEVDSICRIFWL